MLDASLWDWRDPGNCPKKLAHPEFDPILARFFQTSNDLEIYPSLQPTYITSIYYLKSYEESFERWNVQVSPTE